MSLLRSTSPLSLLSLLSLLFFASALSAPTTSFPGDSIHLPGAAVIDPDYSLSVSVIQSNPTASLNDAAVSTFTGVATAAPASLLLYSSSNSASPQTQNTGLLTAAGSVASFTETHFPTGQAQSPTTTTASTSQPTSTKSSGRRNHAQIGGVIGMAFVVIGRLL